MHRRFVLGLVGTVAFLGLFSPTVRAGDAEPAPPGDVRAPARVTGATAQAKAVAASPKRVERVTDYADVELRFAAGALEITAIRRGRFAKPTEIPHYRGRYRLAATHKQAILAERDFDFPLLADAETEDQTVEAQAIAKALRKSAQATTTVRIPLAAEADQIVVSDSRTKQSISQPLPPPPSPSPSPVTSPTGAAPPRPPAAAAGK